MGTGNPDRKSLSALTVAELKQLAARKGVKLKASLKADIVSELARVLKPKKKAAATKAAKKKSPARKKTATREKTAPKKSAPVGKKATTELKSMTVAELKALALKNKISLKSTLKVDIVKELTKALKPVKKAVIKASAAKNKTNKVAPKAAKKAQATPEKKVAAIKTAATVPPRAVAKPPFKAPKAAPKAEAKATPKVEAMVPAEISIEPLADNWVSCLPVSPDKIFVSWELEVKAVRPSNRLVMRISSESRTNGDKPFIQVPVNKAAGGMFINVSPGTNYEAVIGLMSLDGQFMPIATSRQVTTPPGRAPEGQSLMPDEHFAFTKTPADPVSSN